MITFPKLSVEAMPSRYNSDVALVWLELDIPSSGSNADLNPGIVDDEPPDGHWLREELDEAGWDIIFFKSYWGVQGEHGWSYSMANANWALERGLAPRQSFLVYIEKPVWTGGQWCGPYYDEPDVEWTWRFVGKEYQSPQETRASWDKWYKFWKETFTESERRLGEFVEKRNTDIEQMFIKWDSYWPDGTTMVPPRGVEVCLLSNHRQTGVGSKFANAPLATGRSNGGDRELAKQRCFEAALERLPNMTTEILEALPERRW